MSTTTTQPTSTEARDTSGRTRMRAITQAEYGSSEVLKSATIDRPTIGDDEVLIEVHTAGLDRGVWHLTTGRPYLVRLAGFGVRRPKQPVPGLDVSGVVAEIGRKVTRFKVGDEVFGIGTGTYAEFAAAKESKLAHKPANLSFEQAGVATISGITALQALTKVGRLTPGQHVLVIGASGGVGSYAVQLAKALGARVTGVASTAKLDAVRALGADDAIDYTRRSIDDGGRRYDLIIDIGGANRLSRLRRALTPKGTLVIVGAETGGRFTGGVGRQLRALLLSPLVGQRLVPMISSESLDYIEPLAEHLASGAVTPEVGQRFELDQVPDALDAMEAGRLVGKTAINVAADAGTDRSARAG